MDTKDVYDQQLRDKIAEICIIARGAGIPLLIGAVVSGAEEERPTGYGVMASYVRIGPMPDEAAGAMGLLHAACCVLKGEYAIVEVSPPGSTDSSVEA